MKMKTITVSAIAAAIGLAAPMAASALALVYEDYYNTNGFDHDKWTYVVNGDPFTYSDVNIDGNDLGSLAPGGAFLCAHIQHRPVGWA